MNVVVTPDSICFVLWELSGMSQRLARGTRPTCRVLRGGARVTQLAQSLIGIESSLEQSRGDCAHQAEGAEADSFGQVFPVKLPEFLVPATSQQANREKIIVFTQKAIGTHLKFLPGQEVGTMSHKGVQSTAKVCHQIHGQRRRQRLRCQSFETKNLMNKTEVAGFEQYYACFPVGMEICLVIEGIPASDKIRAIKDGSRRPEHVYSLQKCTPAHLASRYQPTGVR
jgi:hypothetical protein